MIKDLVQSIALRAGYEVHALWRVPGLPHARKLDRIFKHFAIDTVLDVGANNGQFRDFVRHQLGFRGQIHSFEPIASLVESLNRRAARDPSWSIHALALGAERGEREINVMNSTVFSSFLQPIHGAVPELTSLNTVSRREVVRIETLDNVVASMQHALNLTRTFLKLDTQGFDLEVLKGGRRAISELPALQTEVSVKPIYDGMPEMAQSFAAFAEMGFFISDLFLVDDGRLHATEFDCLMIRKEDVQRSS